MKAAAAALLAAAWLAAAPVPAATADAARAKKEAEADAQLRALRQRVALLAVAQREDEARRDAGLAALREADAAVAAADRDREAADAGLADADRELAAREGEREALARRLEDERSRLARLVRAAYAQGRHEQLRLLLAQDQVGAAQRALAYQRYLQEARAGEVRGLLDRLDALARATAEVEARRTAQAAAAAAARRARDALAERRREQAEALRALKAGLVARAGEIEALRRDQRALERLLADLRDAIADVPKQLADDRPFASRRGELPLPVQGRVLRRFGAPVAGALTSDGVQFAADEGSAVRAVAPGRVVYADWLRGQGLLLVIDHGGGWMTLYGNAQRLARDVGDWVSAGEVVARAGRSGGAQASGIYFELRRDGQPVDPRGWWR
ncbi:MAG: murein hydrolase activator EnvC family protein [Lysobacteraceae bacterium]|jgi:septal ring factor EnvC (AmiA/AmiB activator)|nr:peptidoglycan DD-metalloendopeptidase family protein [Xanthomonadaceae bacterium]MCZ8318575.1 peptidoglycan DD-metalloendopeptidase family protein [Silanimonas sp.]